MSKTIYRGFDLEEREDQWHITLNGEEGLFDPQPSEAAAMDRVDAYHRRKAQGEEA